VVWFKQLQAFRFTAPGDKQASDLQEALGKQIIGDCPPGVAVSYGWQSPVSDHNQELLVSIGDYHCGCFSVAKRLLPLDVIRQTVAERVAQMESEQGIEVSKRERRRMVEEAHFELLPKAFIQRKSCMVIWDWKNQMMFVSTAQQAMLDSLTASLAFCVPGWMIKICKPEQNVERSLTGWLKESSSLPDGLTWGDACQLADPKDRFCSIRFAGNELQSQSVLQHLQDGMWVKQAQLQWQERIRFVLNPNFTLSQIKYLDLEKDLDDSESPRDKMMTEIALLAPLYNELMQFLANELGGMAELKSKTEVSSDALVSPFAEEASEV